MRKKDEVVKETLEVDYSYRRYDLGTLSQEYGSRKKK